MFIYDKPRQHIKKQRLYLANKGPSSQSYGFSSSHVWTWELDHKEGWVQKNWCFWTVVLEKTLESPLHCKEIKLVNPKGNQFRVFILRCQKEYSDIEGAQTSSLGCTVSSLVCWSGQDFFFLIFIWLRWVLVVACGIYNQGWNPGPLHWECRVLAGGPPGKSPGLSHSSWTQQWFRNWSVIFFFFLV